MTIAVYLRSAITARVIQLFGGPFHDNKRIRMCLLCTFVDQQISALAVAANSPAPEAVTHKAVQDLVPAGHACIFLDWFFFLFSFEAKWQQWKFIFFWRTNWFFCSCYIGGMTVGRHVFQETENIFDSFFFVVSVVLIPQTRKRKDKNEGSFKNNVFPWLWKLYKEV